MNRRWSFRALITAVLAVLILVFAGTACAASVSGMVYEASSMQEGAGETGSGFVRLSKKKKKKKQSSVSSEETAGEVTVDRDGSYTSKEEVALYIHLYGELPGNYISKRDAEELGWNAREGNLDEVAPGKSIGGSRFGNYEGLLPEAKNRKYYECDIDFDGTYRNAKRIVYSNDGLVFYTEDHYKTFERLY